MIDYLTVAERSKYMFEEVDNVTYVAKNRLDGAEVGSVHIEGLTFTADTDEIFFDFKIWQMSPEFQIGKPVAIEGKNQAEIIDEYETLLIGATMLESDSDCAVRYKAALDWLRTTDFYNAPASTVYHESYPSGLLIHTLTVYNKMVQLLALPAFKGVSKSGATLAVLTHDWCKIGLYEAYQKNVKNEQTGQWEQQTAYRTNAKGIPLGHGVSSMFLASKFFKLTPDMALAIRWHMSHWNVADNEVNDLQRANETCPMVHLIQFADQLAITSYARKD